MIGFYHPDAVGENLIDGLNHAVRRETAILSAQVHAAAGTDHPHSQLCGRRKLDAGQVPGACWKYIVVVEAGGAAVFHHFAHRGER